MKSPLSSLWSSAFVLGHFTQSSASPRISSKFLFELRFHSRGYCESEDALLVPLALVGACEYCASVDGDVVAVTPIIIRKKDKYIDMEINENVGLMNWNKNEYKQSCCSQLFLKCFDKFH